MDVPVRHVDLDLLRTFQAVVETGSFASAAEQLGCTQPAVSLQVKRLETLFGQTLIERARPARATEPGQTVLGYARRMLRLNDELLGRFDNAREGVVLRVGIPNDFSVAMLPMALSRFAASEPGVILDLQSDLSVSLLEGLRDRPVRPGGCDDHRAGERSRGQDLDRAAGVDRRARPEAGKPTGRCR